MRSPESPVRHPRPHSSCVHNAQRQPSKATRYSTAIPANRLTAHTHVFSCTTFSTAVTERRWEQKATVLMDCHMRRTHVFTHTHTRVEREREREREGGRERDCEILQHCGCASCMCWIPHAMRWPRARGSGASRDGGGLTCRGHWVCDRSHASTMPRSLCIWLQCGLFTGATAAVPLTCTASPSRRRRSWRCRRRHGRRWCYAHLP